MADTAATGAPPKTGSPGTNPPTANSSAATTSDDEGAGTQTGFRDLEISAQDGVKLYARDYPGPDEGAAPVVCLHGFSGNSRQFHALAGHLAQTRRVVAPDLRGRGRSGYAPKSTYTVLHELLDVLDIMMVAGLHQAVVIGTSRGGILAMMMAAMRPSAISGFVLNDIGPTLELIGLLRIAGQLGNIPRPSGWADAAKLLEQANGGAFPDIGADGWLEVARTRFKRAENGMSAAMVPNYDPALADVLARDAAHARKHAPDYWPQFAALKPFPGLAIRGALSEFLSDDTLAHMAGAHDGLETLIVDKRGHAPMLDEPGVIAAIDRLLARVDHPAR